MKLDIKKFTNIFNKISDLTSGEKNIPGVLLDLVKGETEGVATLRVCYSDGHRSLVEDMEVTTDPNNTDFFGKVATSYEQLGRVVESCQSSGRIYTDNFTITYEDAFLVATVDQFFVVYDEDGNEANRMKQASKTMKIERVVPESNMKTKILVRANYDDIFENDTVDTYDKAVLVDALNRTSVEKGKVIYASQERQEVFVINQAHVTAYPIPARELTPEMDQEIKDKLLEENPQYTNQDYENAVKAAVNHIHMALTFDQPTAKAVASILSRTTADEVQVARNNLFCSIYIDNDDEKLGVWFEMPKAARVHLGHVERYAAFSYSNYQLRFMHDFLDDMVKSALKTLKSEKVELKFKNVVDDLTGENTIEMVVDSSSASASIANVVSVRANEVVDVANDITTRQFKVSLKVLSDMLAQLKTDFIAFDINVGENDTICLRLAEIDTEKLNKEHEKARKEICEGLDLKDGEQGPPTPPEKKIEYRLRTLNVKQFTMLVN